MKKAIVLLVSATLFSLTARAQGPEGLNIGAGVIHNFYIMNDHPDVYLDNSCYFGPYFELGYDLKGTAHSGAYFGVRYEFVHRYAGVGTYGPFGIPVVAETDTYRHYIDIPIKYLFTQRINHATKFFFDLGPTVNFMLGNTTYCREYAPGIWASQKVVWSETAPNAYNWFNLSVGTNIGFYFGHTKVFIGYDYGGMLSYTNTENYGRGQVHQLRIGVMGVF